VKFLGGRIFCNCLYTDEISLYQMDKNSISGKTFISKHLRFRVYDALQSLSIRFEDDLQMRNNSVISWSNGPLAERIKYFCFFCLFVCLFVFFFFVCLFVCFFDNNRYLVVYEKRNFNSITFFIFIYLFYLFIYFYLFLLFLFYFIIIIIIIFLLLFFLLLLFFYSCPFNRSQRTINYFDKRFVGKKKEIIWGFML
jgi:hypothetical protein